MGGGRICVYVCIYTERETDFKELVNSRLEILHIIDVTVLGLKAFWRQNSFLLGERVSTRLDEAHPYYER